MNAAVTKAFPSTFNSSSSWHKIQVKSLSSIVVGLLRFGPEKTNQFLKCFYINISLSIKKALKLIFFLKSL